MSDQLFSSLFSLLPPDSVKGNSSVCDHIEVAANYIKDLEKNVMELQNKREMLKNSILSSDHVSNNNNNNNNNNNIGPSIISSTNPSINENYVKIKNLSEALEIEISAMIKDEDDVFPLSKVLNIIQLEEGLNVLNCAYTKVDDQKWMYIIHCQVSDVKLIDSSRLQWRLTNEISSTHVS
ncbi:unnamed protein product [Amaranthus hypochondriacus]